jgi:hypothetical protein
LFVVCFTGVTTHCGCIFHSPVAGFSLLVFEVSWSDTTTRQVGWAPLDEWSIYRRDLYVTTHNTHNKHPSPPWNSNPRSQQASGRRPTPLSARPLGPALGVQYRPLSSSIRLTDTKVNSPGMMTEKYYILDWDAVTVDTLPQLNGTWQQVYL